MNYQLMQFDEDRLSKTVANWSQTAERLDIPFHQFEKDLAWVGGHIDYSATGDSYAYGIFAEGHQEASAVVDIVYSRRGGKDVGWLKMLEITMGPEFDPSRASSPEVLLEVIRIYVASILGTIGLSDVHKARVIKIFGRNDELSRLLASVQLQLTSLNQQGKTLGFSSKFEGRWLVIAVN